jgi:hypothetical protein
VRYIYHLNIDIYLKTTKYFKYYDVIIGSNIYVRPDAFKDEKEGEDEAPVIGQGDDDASKLRFSYRLTAFDTDVDEGQDQPWRKPRVDISDFFNYGFTEATWKVFILFFHYTNVFIRSSKPEIIYILYNFITRSIVQSN